MCDFSLNVTSKENLPKARLTFFPYVSFHLKLVWHQLLAEVQS